MQTASEAYEAVLKNAGCNRPVRDTLDQRIVRDVRRRTGGLIDVQGRYPHGTAYEQTVTAWPFLKSLPAPKDSDGDGMPDDWEGKQGLNAADPSDASSIKLHALYTNIEVYINGLTN
jgi:hypothetical protein